MKLSTRPKFHRPSKMETTWNKNQKNQPYDNSWYTELGLGLKAIAVTAPVCPRKTEIGSPSGKRH